MGKNYLTLFSMKFYGSTLILSHLWSTRADLYNFEKNPFRQICPLRAFFRSSQFKLFFFELPLHHQFWSDIQNLCDMHTSRPRGFHRMLWMVPRFIRLGGVTPPKYMELFFWDEGSIILKGLANSGSSYSGRGKWLFNSKPLLSDRYTASQSREKRLNIK